MMYKTFHTQDGGMDGYLEDILSHLSSLSFQRAVIEAGLLTHGDRTCKYFRSELNVVADDCRTILAILSK